MSVTLDLQAGEPRVRRNWSRINDLFSGAATDVAGVVADLATLGVTVAAHIAATTSVHGIANTAALATDDDIAAVEEDIAATHDDLVYLLNTHAALTTSVHGISNTANLVYTADSRLSNARTPTAHASTHASAGSDIITALGPITFSGRQIVNYTSAISSGLHVGLDIASTYTQTGTAAGTDIRINNTGTHGSGNNLFLDFQVGGVSIVYLDRAGNLYLGGAGGGSITGVGFMTTAFGFASLGGLRASPSGTQGSLYLTGGDSNGNRSVAIDSLYCAYGTSTNTSGTSSALLVTPTYNQTSGTATNYDIRVVRIETATGSGGQYLLGLTVGSNDRHTITNVAVQTSALPTSTSHRTVFAVTPTHPVTTDASYTSRVVHSVTDFGATREIFREEADGSAARIGFLGATAVVRQTLAAAATDAATTQNLANDLRTALINLGLCT